MTLEDGRLKRLWKIRQGHQEQSLTYCLQNPDDQFSTRKGTEPGKMDSSKGLESLLTTYGANDQGIRNSVPKDRTIKL